MDVGRCSCLLWGRLEVGDFLRLFLTQTALFCDFKFCYLELIARWVVPKPQSRTQNILFCCSCTVSLRKACMPSAYDMAILSYKEENNYVWLLLGWWKLEKKNKIWGVTLLKLKAKVFDRMSKAVEICNSFHLLPLVHGNRALVPAHVPETEESLGNHSVCSAACEGASEPQFCLYF